MLIIPEKYKRLEAERVQALQDTPSSYLQVSTGKIFEIVICKCLVLRS